MQYVKPLTHGEKIHRNADLATLELAILLA